jgi:hypothetical protein
MKITRPCAQIQALFFIRLNFSWRAYHCRTLTDSGGGGGGRVAVFPYQRPTGGHLGIFQTEDGGKKTRKVKGRAKKDQLKRQARGQIISACLEMECLKGQ